MSAVQPTIFVANHQPSPLTASVIDTILLIVNEQLKLLNEQNIDRFASLLLPPLSRDCNAVIEQNSHIQRITLAFPQQASYEKPLLDLSSKGLKLSTLRHEPKLELEIDNTTHVIKFLNGNSYRGTCSLNVAGAELLSLVTYRFIAIKIVPSDKKFPVIFTFVLEELEKLQQQNDQSGFAHIAAKAKLLALKATMQTALQLNKLLFSDMELSLSEDTLEIKTNASNAAYFFDLSAPWQLTSHT